MAEAKAPGKLMLSGEWSVLEPDIPCIVLAVDRYVKAKAESSTETEIELKDFGIKVKAAFDGNRFSAEASGEEEKKLSFAIHAAEATLRYLKGKGREIRPFRLSTESEISLVELADGTKTKVGFGSSAAAVVAIITALMEFYGEDTKSSAAKERIYKLGCIAHYFAQGKVGSAFDVAASAYAQPIIYRKFDGSWLSSRIESGSPVTEIVESAWAHLSVEPIKLPDDFRLCVGFTGYSASTKELVLKIREAKKEDPDNYSRIINSIKGVTESLISAVKAGDKEGMLQAVRENRKYLKEFSDFSGNNLETEELKKLIELADSRDAAAKFSGAGGGDCAIAVCFSDEVKKQILKKWEDAGLYPMDVKVVQPQP
jgi:phosphomevalonate kinase